MISIVNLPFGAISLPVASFTFSRCREISCLQLSGERSWYTVGAKLTFAPSGSSPVRLMTRLFSSLIFSTVRTAVFAAALCPVGAAVAAGAAVSAGALSSAGVFSSAGALSAAGAVSSAGAACSAGALCWAGAVSAAGVLCSAGAFCSTGAVSAAAVSSSA